MCDVDYNLNRFQSADLDDNRLAAEQYEREEEYEDYLADNWREEMHQFDVFE